jgi:hypothetical protein
VTNPVSTPSRILHILQILRQKFVFGHCHVYYRCCYCYACCVPWPSARKWVMFETWNLERFMSLVSWWWTSRTMSLWAVDLKYGKVHVFSVLTVDVSNDVFVSCSISPSKFQHITSNWPNTAFCPILSNSLFTNHPTIRYYVVWATGSSLHEL